MLFGLLDAALDFANRIEVLTQPGLVAGAELSSKASHVLGHPVENAATLAQFSAPALGAAPVAEQAFEDHARVSLGGKGRRRRQPGQIVLVRARKAVIAVSNLSDQVRSDFKRRNGCVLADVFRGYLVDRCPQLIVAAFGSLRLRTAEESAVSRRVVARGIRVPELEIRHHRYLIQKRHE